MNIIFNNDNPVGTKGLVSYHITNEKKDDIGTVEGAGNENGIFMSIVKIYNPNFQKNGLGFKSFKKVYDEINQTYPISIIKASWHKGGEFKDFKNGMSTNLLLFRKNSNKMNEEDNVFSTPTGKWAKKIGFNKYKIITDSDEEVVINFSK
jgi:hypothetical protein